MSQKLVSHSQDLKKLQDQGFEIIIQGVYLLVDSVPYLNSQREIKQGTLVSKITLAGDRTAPTDDHVIFFIGEFPCDVEGNPIPGIAHSSADQTLDNGLVVNHSFSNKPPDRMFSDYHEKITSYVNIISSHAQAVDPDVTAKTFKVVESEDPEIVFQYFDTNSSRAEINMISSKLEGLKIAIIGLGGTGSYVLDLVAKTSVKEIHLYDKDTFLQHNAFRAPGATPKNKLDEQPKKVLYLHEIYSNIHKYVIPHEEHLNSSNIDQVSDMNFVFICIDTSEEKKLIMDELLARNISFIDVGIGVEEIDGALIGSARITTCTPEKNDHIKTRVSFSDAGDDLYGQNIQIAELNALNAALAVIKWKKIYGVYHDQEKEHNSSYEISINKIINDESIT